MAIPTLSIVHFQLSIRKPLRVRRITGGAGVEGDGRRGQDRSPTGAEIG